MVSCYNCGRAGEWTACIQRESSRAPELTTCSFDLQATRDACRWAHLPS